MDVIDIIYRVLLKDRTICLQSFSNPTPEVDQFYEGIASKDQCSILAKI